MTFEEIKRRYNRLSSSELEKELAERSARRRSTWMVGAEGCMIESYIKRACREILAERNLSEQV